MPPVSLVAIAGSKTTLSPAPLRTARSHFSTAPQTKFKHLITANFAEHHILQKFTSCSHVQITQNLYEKPQRQNSNINMPISDFRKKKLLYVFNVFFDVNQSGTIDRKDFELAIEKICTLRGWSAGSPQYAKTFESMIQIWDGLRQRADSNKDGQVSVEEWSSMWDDYAKNPENALDWQMQYLRFMFDLEDASGDGSIDIDEFTSVCSCYGLQIAECKDAFHKMAKGKSEVNYEQFVELWKQFFMTENPSEPGNFIFGKTSF